MSRSIKVFKGVDNFIDVAVKDQEQQSLSVSEYSFHFKVRDREANIIIDKALGFVEGCTDKLAVDLLVADLDSIDLGSYVWGITVVDEDNKTRPLFLALNGDIEGTLQVENSPIS